jgi:hypothetical protein
MNILLEAVGEFSYSKLGGQFVLDGQTFNYVKKTNFYVNSKYQSLYEDSGYDNIALLGGDPYAYKYAGDKSAKEFFAKQSELPL